MHAVTFKKFVKENFRLFVDLYILKGKKENL